MDKKRLIYTLTKGVGGSLLDLFRNGEDGFLFGPFDTFERLFLTSTGSTGNVAANDDPVGLNLDRHSWGGASRDAIISAATEIVPDGTFDTDLGNWSVAASSAPSTFIWSGGQAVSQTDGVAIGRLRSPAYPTVVGRLYRVSSTGTAGLRVGTASGNDDILAASANTTRYFVAVGTSTYLSSSETANGRTLDNVSLKLIPGNHALQATTTKRPLWKANSGKPYLNFDGTDDYLGTPYIPGSAGTVAAAFRSATASAFILAGGISTGNKRCRIGLGAGGIAQFDFNTSAEAVGSTDLRNTDAILIQTWGGGVHRCYVNGTLLVDEAVSANMDGTGAAFALGSIEAGTSAFSSARIYAALARSTLSSPSEIATITREFQRTYQ